MDKLDKLDKAIINYLQEDFPVCEHPYRQVAEQLGISEQVLLQRLDALLNSGVLSRFGPLFHAEKMGGALTLAALKVPEHRFDEVTSIVNSFAEVAHNYQRQHELNMWFVLATETVEQMEHTLQEIELKTGLPVYNMPRIQEYYVGLRLEV